MMKILQMIEALEALGVVVPTRPQSQVPIAVPEPESPLTTDSMMVRETREDGRLLAANDAWRAAIIALYDAHTVDRFLNPGASAVERRGRAQGTEG